MNRLLLAWLCCLSTLAGESLQTVYRLPARHGTERFITAAQYGFTEVQAEAVPAFRAVVTNRWHPGLVPIFGVVRKGQFELRRLPPRGQENITEPLFFALPGTQDVAAVQIAGRWKCEARRGDGALVYPDFEVAAEVPRIAVRFDQGTEFRFAFISEGTFISNRVQWRVDNVSDRYEMEGRLDGQKLVGNWKHLDGDESGTWEAERDLPVWQSPEESKALYEWRNADGWVRYRWAGENLEGWTRASQPLARVWPVR